ncbi:MAG: CPXCG motif-containing cysteine-rich protein [Thermoanaerobaculia bacterium]
MDAVPVTCPYCGENVEVFLEEDLAGDLVQDCEVCCNPWTVRISGSGEGRRIEVARGDGSE